MESQAIEQILVKPEVTTIEMHFQLEVTSETEAPIKTEAPDYTDNNTHQNFYIEPSSSNLPEITGKVYENGKRNRIQCPLCDKSLKNRANFKQHINYVHSTQGEQKECNICCRLFKSYAHLRSHINSVHVKDESVTCECCNKTFLSKKRLNNHIFYTHRKPDESTTCEICQKTFKQKYNLKVHMRQIHSDADKAVTCDICNKTFKNKMLLQKHMKWAHPSDGMVYKCQECSRTLPSLPCLKSHIENVHTTSNIPCDKCQCKFKTLKTLKRHEKTIHGDEKRPQAKRKEGGHKCSECEKSFASNTALSWHYERCHSENRETTCQICKLEFPDYMVLKKHKLTHNLETEVCNICQKAFRTVACLQRHVRVTHAPPDAEETCEICQKTFKCAMHLRIHHNAVHKMGSFTCDLCNKEFTSKKYMTKHRKIHVDSKDFKCHLCPKFYKSQHDVTKHCRRVHKMVVNLVNKCQLCNIEFSNYLYLAEHNAKTHNVTNDDVNREVNSDSASNSNGCNFSDMLKVEVLTDDER